MEVSATSNIEGIQWRVDKVEIFMDCMDCMD